MTVDFTQFPKKVILDTIRIDNPDAADLSEAAVVFGVPADDADPLRDTSLVLTGVEEEGYSNSVTIRYKRVNLANMPAGRSTDIYILTGENFLWDLLPRINLMYLVNLTPEDIVDVVLDKTIGATLVVEAAPGSLVYKGQFEMTIVMEPVDEPTLRWDVLSDPAVFPAQNSVYRGVIHGVVTNLDNFTVDLAWEPGTDGDSPPLLTYDPQGDVRSVYVEVQYAEGNTGVSLSSGKATITLSNNGVPLPKQLILVISDTTIGLTELESVGTYHEESEIAQVIQLTGSGTVQVPIGTAELSLTVVNASGSELVQVVPWVDQGSANVASGNGIFVAMGRIDYTSNFLATSPDGENWTAHPPITIDNTVWWKPIFVNGKFYAFRNGGGAGYFIESTDGVNWAAVTGLDPLNRWKSIAFVDGWYLALGYGPTAVMVASISEDGATWSVEAVPTLGLQIPDMVAGNGVFVVGTSGSQVSVGTITAGVLSWQLVALPSVGDSFRSLAFGVGVFVMFTYYSGFIHSTDGVNWTFVAHTIAGDNNGVYFDGVKLVATHPYETHHTLLQYSANGTNWTSGPIIQGRVMSTASLPGVIVLGGTFSSAPLDTFKTVLEYSLDGGVSFITTDDPEVIGADATVTINGFTLTFEGVVLESDVDQVTQVLALDTAVPTTVDYVCPLGTTVLMVYGPPVGVA